jgi:hypothetical protein
MGSIDVGYEMNPQALLSIGLKRLGDHQRTEIRTADTDVDHITNRQAAITEPSAAMHLRAKTPHLLQNTSHLRHDILPSY